MYFVCSNSGLYSVSVTAVICALACNIGSIYNDTGLFQHEMPAWQRQTYLNTLRPRQNGRHFTDDTFKRIFLNDIVRIPIKISLKFVPKDPVINIPALVQIMAWRRPGDKPLSEPMMVSLLMHICVTQPQWVKIGKQHPITGSRRWAMGCTLWIAWCTSCMLMAWFHALPGQQAWDSYCGISRLLFQYIDAVLLV